LTPRTRRNKVASHGTTKTPQALQPKLEVRLRSRQALKDAMAFNRMTIRELSDACGNPRYRSTIGHLHSGARTTCSPHLARRIEECLRLYPNALFELRVTSDNFVATPRKRAA
jgi:hypothetical protein